MSLIVHTCTHAQPPWSSDLWLDSGCSSCRQGRTFAWWRVFLGLRNALPKTRRQRTQGVRPEGRGPGVSLLKGSGNFHSRVLLKLTPGFSTPVWPHSLLPLTHSVPWHPDPPPLLPSAPDLLHLPPPPLPPTSWFLTNPSPLHLIVGGKQHY